MDRNGKKKADQIRIYNGSGYEQVQQAAAGEICSVTGLSKTYAGEGLGAQTEPVLPLLEPVLTYQIELPPDCDAHTMLKNLQAVRGRGTGAFDCLGGSLL